jgi:uncharacterized protein YceK
MKKELFMMSALFCVVLLLAGCASKPTATQAAPAESAAAQQPVAATPTADESASGTGQVNDLEQTYFVSANGDDSNDGTAQTSSFKTLAKAIAAATGSDIKTITIVGILDGGFMNIQNSGTAEICITGKPNATEAEKAILNETRIVVKDNSTIRFENIVFTNGDTVLVLTTGAQVTLGTGTVISGNESSEGGIVHLYDGTLIMQDNALIAHNTSTYMGRGGVVIEGGSFTMGDTASITDNLGWIGGGVGVSDGGTFTMNGGSITDNTTIFGQTGPSHGGGVFVSTTGVFNQNGGTITGNKAERYDDDGNPWYESDDIYTDEDE